MPNKDNKYFELLFKEYKTLQLDKKQVAKILNISEVTLDRKLNNGELMIPFNILGRKKLFPLGAIAEYLQALEDLKV